MTSYPSTAPLLSSTFIALAVSLSPAAADSFTVTDVLGSKDGISVSIPTLEVIDGNMTEADIRSVFAGSDIAAIARSIGSWDAASVRIPEIRYKQVGKIQDGPETTFEFAYRDLTIENLQDGVAQSSRIEGGDIKVTGAEGMTGSIGTLTTGMVDFASLAGFYAGGGGEMKTIYKDIAFEGSTISGPKGQSCDIGKISAAEFKARPMQQSFAELMALIASLEKAQPAPPPPAELQKLFAFYSDMLNGMEFSKTSFDGMNCSLADEQGQQIKFSIGQIEADGFAQGRYLPITMNGLDIAVADEGFVKAGKIVFKGMDLGGVLTALQAAGDQLNETWFQQNFRKLMPSFGGFAIENMSIDVPDESNPGQRVKGSLGGFDITLEAYELGIPTNISIVTQGAAFALPDTAEAAQIRALGYDSIDLSSVIKLHWDEASKTIVVDELSATGADMGSVKLTAVIGNADANLFAEDPQIQQLAAMGLSVKEATVSTEDEGVADKIFTMVGAQQGQDAAAIRTQISGMAAGMVPMMLGGTEQAQEVANAVMTFLNGGASLSITAAAKDSAGIGLIDFMAAQQNPSALAEKLDFSAEAK